MGPCETFILAERGPGVEALSAALEWYLYQYPESVLLKKWLEDSIQAAENVFIKGVLQSTDQL